MSCFTFLRGVVTLLSVVALVSLSTQKLLYVISLQDHGIEDLTSARGSSFR
jgi:hypothetical protein